MSTQRTDFMECAACRAKPGTPFLCEACLHNRWLISTLRAEIERMRPVYSAAIAWGRQYAIDPTSGAVDEADGVLWRAIASRLAEEPS